MPATQPETTGGSTGPDASSYRRHRSYRLAQFSSVEAADRMPFGDELVHEQASPPRRHTDTQEANLPLEPGSRGQEMSRAYRPNKFGQVRQKEVRRPGATQNGP
jgi:hypothetical protein